MRVALAKQGVFQTVQGEGALLGVPMVFIRMAGCSIGCAGCDTNYRLHNKQQIEDVVAEAKYQRSSGTRWAWITGGEPTDQECLPELVSALKQASFKVALATAGHRTCNLTVDWLSVSPHAPRNWVQLIGSELKIVPSLNGFNLDAFADKAREARFDYKYVSPCDGRPETLSECLDFVKRNEGWRLNVQAHKMWEIP